MNAEVSRKAAAGLPPSMRRLLADLWRGTADSRKLVDWATDQLVAGKDSPNLRILAGLSGVDSREARDYFHKALGDLRFPIPNERDCMIYCCGDLARAVIENRTGPLPAFNTLWQITVYLGYPHELLCWRQLEIDLDILEDQKCPPAQLEAAIRRECSRFLTLLDCYTDTGVVRLTLQRSLDTLRARGWEVPPSVDHIPKRLPQPDDVKPGVSFFRTRVEKEDFRDLTLPRSLFLRSDIAQCCFVNADLSESSATWCDWKDCDFTRANLSECDLRKSTFDNCCFYGCTLDDADLRGAQFANCQFGRTSMKGAKLEKFFGFFTTPRRHRMRLSTEQAKEIAWARTSGDEPPGG